MTMNRDPYVTNDAINNVYVANPELVNNDRSVAPIIAFLSDHKAETLERLVATAQQFLSTHNTGDTKFLLAPGRPRICAPTDILAPNAKRLMFFMVHRPPTLLSVLPLPTLPPAV